MKKETSPARTVDDYLKPLPPEVRKSLQTLREQIKSAAPEAEELISYQIPTYKQNGPLVHFAAFPNHCSLVAVNKDLVKKYSTEWKSHKVSGTTIQFTADHPIDPSLVKKIVKERIAQNAERVQAKELASKSNSAKEQPLKTQVSQKGRKKI